MAKSKTVLLTLSLASLALGACAGGPGGYARQGGFLQYIDSQAAGHCRGGLRMAGVSTAACEKYAPVILGAGSYPQPVGSGTMVMVPQGGQLVERAVPAGNGGFIIVEKEDDDDDGWATIGKATVGILAVGGLVCAVVCE